MASISKLSFRARNLDSSKSMPIYTLDELPDFTDCTPINRAVAQMPTGMEKDEEMESHLQEAIIAQQASTSGVLVENHVIPTPKVTLVDNIYYDTLYPSQPAPPKNQLIKVQASLTVDKEQPEYDIDSEDEAWLTDRPHILCDDFEKIMELLEGASSDVQICQPQEARSLLKDFDADLIDDVYDYWLEKRKEVAAERKIACLIPRIKTDNRRDAPGIVNPYVAFRRRAEKMQTRRNRKNDEESYEKVLRLGNDLRKASILFEMIRRREKSKLALINRDAEILNKRIIMNEFSPIIHNQFLSKVKDEIQPCSSSAEDSTDEINGGFASTSVEKVHTRKKHRSSTTLVDDNIDFVTRAWLKRNAEAWNRPSPSFFGQPSSVTTFSLAGAERGAATELSADGRYTFKRRRGCIYRDNEPTSSNALTLSSGVSADIRKLPMEDRFNCLSSFTGMSNVAAVQSTSKRDIASDVRSIPRRFYRTVLPSSSGVLKCIGFARRRIGRGGRIIYDHYMNTPPSTSQCSLNDCDPIIDTSRTYQPKMDQDPCSKENVLEDSDNEKTEAELWEREYQEREERYRVRIYESSGDRWKLFDDRNSSLNEATRTIQCPDSTSELNHNNSVSSFKEATRTFANGLYSVRSLISEDGCQKNERWSTDSRLYSQKNTQNNRAIISDSSSQTAGFDCIALQYQNSHTDISPANESIESSNGSAYRQPGDVVSQVAHNSVQEGTPIFYPQLPPPAPIPGLEEAGGQTIRNNVNDMSDSKRRHLAPQNWRIVTTTQEDQLCYGRIESPKMRVNGSQRIKLQGSRSVDHYMPSVLADTHPHRVVPYGSLKVNPKSVSSVDTRRLELAIVGSGTRVKACHNITPSPSVTCEGARPLAMEHSGRSSMVTDNLGATSASHVTYLAPHYTPAVGDPHRSPPQSSLNTNTGYYPLSDNLNGITSSPDSESMSPPMSSSPAVTCDLSSHSFGLSTKVPPPVAIVSCRCNRVELSQVDLRHKDSSQMSWNEKEVPKLASFRDSVSLLGREARSPPGATVATVPLTVKAQLIPLPRAYLNSPLRDDLIKVALANGDQPSLDDQAQMKTKPRDTNQLYVPSKLGSSPIVEGSAGALDSID